MTGVEAPLYERWIAKLPAERRPGRCWEWQGARNPEGYGRIRGPHPEGRTLQAHRVGYEFFRGPIPDGLVLDHLCRNRACVNPSHLQAVTDAVNIQRGDSPGMRTVRTDRCKRDHPFSTSAYVRKSGKRECRVCRRDKREAARLAAGMTGAPA